MTLVRANTPTFGGFFDEFFNHGFTDHKSPFHTMNFNKFPQVNVVEKAESFTIEMAIPGREKSDFNIQVKENHLTISSEVNEEKKNKEGYTYQEFTHQSFTRTFTLPESADDEKINASYENGILTIEIAKKEEAKPKEPKAISIT